MLWITVFYIDKSIIQMDKWHQQMNMDKYFMWIHYERLQSCAKPLICIYKWLTLNINICYNPIRNHLIKTKYHAASKICSLKLKSWCQHLPTINLRAHNPNCGNTMCSSHVEKILIRVNHNFANAATAEIPGLQWYKQICDLFESTDWQRKTIAMRFHTWAP